ncbi:MULTISPECIES: helix-turn-helix domain-containing protein [Paraburkholderia]|uniref:Helix-turn-helix domain-containing protein n=1 Tax=Paraburkholderia podalyriae TaxID=1938811 RepID=A0ABR7PZ27_9BURK|nr:helix-turn-helix domain-containing protein [Paraburkholderia podalyriae]
MRAARGFSRDALSEYAELSRNYVTRLESQKPNADLKHLEKLAHALDIPISRLIGPPACDHKVSKR